MKTCKNFGENMEKNVLIYAERWCSGGIESLISNLVSNLDKSKFNIKILVSQKETSIYDDLLDNIKIEEILKEKVENPFVRMFKTIIKFKKTIKNKTIDVIHINIYNGVGMIYAYLAHKLGIKNIIVHAHNNGIDNDKFKIKLILHKICKTLFSKYANYYIACSNEAARFCYNIPNDKKMIIINNGIDVERFKYDDNKRNEYRKEFGVKDNFVIGNVARLVEQKNPEFLLDIFAEIKKIKNNSKLIMVGSGTLEKKIKQKMQKAKLENDVIMLKERNDINNILQVFDIFCLPSKYEGLGIVTIEAQACGLKCVVSDMVPDAVKITPNIISIPLEESAKDWAKKIIEFVSRESNKDVLNYIKKSGYEIKGNTAKMEKIYLANV